MNAIWWPVTSTTTTGYLNYYPLLGSLSEPERHTHPMNISTLAQLEAIPIDRIVRVDQTDWTRTEKGLTHDGVDLPLFHFEGRVLAGAVLDPGDASPEAGQWWAGSTRTYYLTNVDATYVRYVSFRDARIYNWQGSSRLRTWRTSATLHLLSGAPQVLADSGLAAAAEAYGTLYQTHQATQRTLEVVREEAEQLRRQARAQARKPEVIRNSIAAIRTNLDAIAQLMEE